MRQSIFMILALGAFMLSAPAIAQSSESQVNHVLVPQSVVPHVVGTTAGGVSSSVGQALVAPGKAGTQTADKGEAVGTAGKCSPLLPCAK